jgi:putative effector of murein hydrolase LrgA (UPF0299 family)
MTYTNISDDRHGGETCLWYKNAAHLHTLKLNEHCNPQAALELPMKHIYCILVSFWVLGSALRNATSAPYVPLSTSAYGLLHPLHPCYFQRLGVYSLQLAAEETLYSESRSPCRFYMLIVPSAKCVTHLPQMMQHQSMQHMLVLSLSQHKYLGTVSAGLTVQTRHRSRSRKRRANDFEFT